MAKKNKIIEKVSSQSTLINNLQQRIEVAPYVENLQKFAINIQKKLSPCEVLEDIKLNLDSLRSRAFLGLQVKRLLSAKVIQNDIENTFVQFQEIISQDIVVNSSSRTKLDPHCKSESDFSSAIDHYKKWLVQVLFLFIFFSREENFNYEDKLIEEYLLYIYQIFKGKTISKVKMRNVANINGDVIIDLNSHAALLIHSHNTLPHWVQVTSIEHNLDGYIPAAYAKIIE